MSNRGYRRGVAVGQVINGSTRRVHSYKIVYIGAFPGTGKDATLLKINGRRERILNLQPLGPDVVSAVDTVTRLGTRGSRIPNDADLLQNQTCHLDHLVSVRPLCRRIWSGVCLRCVAGRTDAESSDLLSASESAPTNSKPLIHFDQQNAVRVALARLRG